MFTFIVSAARLIPKGAIAYAGTYAVGKSLEFYYGGNGNFSRGQRRLVYREALDRGREVAAGVPERIVTAETQRR